MTLSNKKIMVVDDDPVILRYLVNIFNHNGYPTCEAENGVEAMRVIAEEKPDLITLDIQMPEEYGPRFFRRITKDERFAQIPVIVISGVTGRHLAIGRAVASLSKPFDPEQLIGIVKNTIG